VDNSLQHIRTLAKIWGWIPQQQKLKATQFLGLGVWKMGYWRIVLFEVKFRSAREPVTGTVATTAPVPAVACDWLMQSHESQQPEPAILFTYSLHLYAKTT